MTTEDDALDSYQNLLFSIARFHEYTGRWPSRITVVGYEFKRRRFTELHRAALRWPADRFEYVGIDAQGDSEAARQGEVRPPPFLSPSRRPPSLLLFVSLERRIQHPWLRSIEAESRTLSLSRDSPSFARCNPLLSLHTTRHSHGIHDDIHAGSRG